MAVKYPHMLPREERIWDAFCERYGTPEGLIRYDVHLGSGAAVDEAWPEWMKVCVKALSTHRADVVVERLREVVIVEVKSIAGMGAVGQCVGYEALWLKEYGTKRPVTLLCVCERLEADIASVFQFYDIGLVELGDVG
jgi:hypothetical protein